MRRPTCKNLKNLERQFNECLVCNVFTSLLPLNLIGRARQENSIL